MGILRKKRSGSSCFVFIRGNAACIYESPHRAALKINYWTGMLFRWDCNPSVQLLTADYTCYRLASAVTMHYSSACVWTTVTIHYISACVCVRARAHRACAVTTSYTSACMCVYVCSDHALQISMCVCACTCACVRVGVCVFTETGVGKVMLLHIGKDCCSPLEQEYYFLSISCQCMCDSVLCMHVKNVQN